MKICVYAITHNDALHLENFAATVKGADCVCILDYNSTDGTVEKQQITEHVLSLAVPSFSWDTALSIGYNFAVSCAQATCPHDNWRHVLVFPQEKLPDDWIETVSSWKGEENIVFRTDFAVDDDVWYCSQIRCSDTALDKLLTPTMPNIPIVIKNGFWPKFLIWQTEPSFDLKSAHFKFCASYEYSCVVGAMLDNNDPPLPDLLSAALVDESNKNHTLTYSSLLVLYVRNDNVSFVNEQTLMFRALSLCVWKEPIWQLATVSIKNGDYVGGLYWLSQWLNAPEYGWLQREVSEKQAYYLIAYCNVMLKQYATALRVMRENDLIDDATNSVYQEVLLATLRDGPLLI